MTTEETLLLSSLMPVQFRSIQPSVNDRMKKLDQQFDTSLIHHGRSSTSNNSGNNGGNSNGGGQLAGAAAAAAAAAAFRMPLTMPLNMPISLAMATVPALNNLNNLAGIVGGSSSIQQQAATTPASVGSAGSLGGSGNSFTDSDSDDGEPPPTNKTRILPPKSCTDGKPTSIKLFSLSRSKRKCR